MLPAHLWIPSLIRRGLAPPLLLIASAAAAQQTPSLAIGVVLPPADAALDGVRLGAAEAEHAAALFGTRFALHAAAVASAADAAAAARRLIGEHHVSVIIGGADAAHASALMDVAERDSVVFINVGAPADSLRLRCTTFTFHVVPAESMLEDALAAAAARSATAHAWHATLFRYGAAQVNDRFRAMFERPIDERAWAGWIAVKAAWEAALRARAALPVVIARTLAGADFLLDGHKGIPLSFRARTHQLRQPVYVLAGDSLVAEIPSPRDDPELDPASLLDRIGIGSNQGDAACAHR